MADQNPKTTEAQRRASRAWEERNREKNRFDTARRQAKRYIRDFAKEENLEEVEQWISARREALKEQA